MSGLERFIFLPTSTNNWFQPNDGTDDHLKNPACTISTYMKLFLLLLSCFITVCFESFGQTHTLDKTLTAFEKQVADLPVEKVHLHLDKEYYTSGDTIWLKGYTVRGAKHELSDLSGVLNVELINNNKVIIRRIKLSIEKGLTQGDIALPDTLPQGNYVVRAYTKWMQNFGPEFFFNKKIRLVNFVNRREKEIIKPTAENIDVQFLPEGGTFINGVPSKIAFKAIGTNGLGVDIKGVIVDGRGEEVVAFSSSRLGMGVLRLIPEAGKKYSARIIYRNNKTTSVDLPEAASNGYALAVENSQGENVRVTIAAGGDKNTNNLTLIAHAGGHIYFAGKPEPAKTKAALIIPRKLFPSGIVQFVLLSADGDPLNERSAFVQNPDQLKLDIRSNASYSIHEKVTVELSAKTNDGQPTSGSFSVSVINENDSPSDQDVHHTILTNLLLTSDISGLVEQPGYYFNNVNEKTSADLDVLMLTQGYHRFEWKKLANSEIPDIKYPVENDLTVSGKVLIGSKPVVDGKVSLLSPLGGAILDTITNEQGRFSFDKLFFIDGSEIVIQARTSKGKDNVSLQLDMEEIPQISELPDTDREPLSLSYLNNAGRIYNEKRKYGMINGNNAIILNEVKIVGDPVEQEKKSALAYSSNLNGPGNADQVIYPDHLLTGCTNLVSCLVGRLTGVQRVDSGGNQFFVSQRTSKFGNATSIRFAMGVIYNGMFINAEQTVSFLERLNINDVSAIEVLRSAPLLATYGSRGGNGLLIITTKHGVSTNLDVLYSGKKSTNLLRLNAAGFYNSRQFYSPKYTPSTEQKPDLRSTVYWNPSLQTDQQGKNSFEFINTDKTGNYNIIIEGIDQAGRLGRQTYHYTVR